ncbi:ribosomal subunit 39S-domain-containing protein [Calycina marina]|uniref:Large ribosomal subunit protein mL50 n=1 Tax=Calycina marina TaxID=1763456 RepID=A0A9P7Z5T9_9HELO|nr:ribosomal subunit 39S-domain-containing protein [Calycina marina]
MKRIARISRSIGHIQSCNASSRTFPQALQAPAFSTTPLRPQKPRSAAGVGESRIVESPMLEEFPEDGKPMIINAEMQASATGSLDGELSETQMAYIKQQMEKRWKYHQEQGNRGNEEDFKDCVRQRLENKIREDNLNGDNRPEYEYKKNKSNVPKKTFQNMEVVKPERLVATAVDHNAYEHASTWEGLDEVGVILPELYTFTGFTPGFVTTDNLDMEMALHRAMVEVFAVKQAELPTSMVSRTHPQKEQLTYFAQLKSTKNGVKLEMKGGVTSEQVIKQLFAREAHDVPAAPALEYETCEDLIASWGSSWLDISLEDPEVKFAILKRIFQLTGNRLSDSKLRSITTASSLRNIIITPPKPERVAEALAVKQELVTLPNVSVFERRQGVVNKETAVGRWKVIAKELEERGLPIPGRKEAGDGQWTTSVGR